MHLPTEDPQQDRDGADFAHRLATPVAKLRLYAKTLGQALPGLMDGHRAADPAGRAAALPTELLAILPEIPARLTRLADEFERVIDTVRGRPTPRSLVPALTDAQSPGLDGHPADPPPRVLLVEDDADSRDLMGLVLAQAGWRVVEAGDGRPALELLGRERFDLILLDCRLPEVDGWETTARLRAAGPNRNTPVVGLTASPDAADRVRALAVGMNDCIIKPLTAAHLAGLQHLYQTSVPTAP